MKGIIKTAIKKVTLELVYQVVDERTTEIVSEVKEIKKRQEDDFRYLVQRIDTGVGQVRGEIGQLRTEMKDDIKRLDGKIDQLNQRIDTIIQMLMTFKQGH